DPGTQESHQVVDRVSRLDVPALRVDEHRDVVARLARQRQQLRGDVGCDPLRDLAADDHGSGAEQALGDQVVWWRKGRLERRQLFHRDSAVRSYAVVLRRRASSASARVTYTRVICFRQERSKSVLSIGFAGRYAASAAAAITSAESAFPRSAPAASGISWGCLATPPSTIRASAALVPSHRTHA